MRADGRTHIELTVGVPDELSTIEIEEVDDRVLVTVFVGIDASAVGKAYTAIGIPATAELRLTTPIVDGSRPGHRP